MSQTAANNTATTPLSQQPTPLASLVAALKEETQAAVAQSSSTDEKSAIAEEATASTEDQDGDGESESAHTEDDDNGPPINPLSDDESDDDADDDQAASDVQLGFLEEALHPSAMLRTYFPCKVGGKPAWLNPKVLPSTTQLTCAHCKNPMIFLLQLYAPLRTTYGSHPGSFHRTLFLFCCLDAGCTNKQTSFICLRSQLPRVNPFYPDVAPPKLEEYEGDEALPIWEDEPYPGVELCCVCGNPGPSSCSRCHARRYCSKLHQIYDWKQGQHKTKCQAPKSESSSESTAASSTVSSTTSSTTAPPAAPASLLFPQQEIVLESEYDPEAEAEKKKADATKTKTKEELLLEAYQQQKNAEGADGEDSEDEEELASAVENWHSPKLKDPLFLKFKTRIAENPDQILRYDRSPDEYSEASLTKYQPLWVSNWFQPASPPMEEPKIVNGKKLPPPRPVAPTALANDAQIPRCACGARRRFEFQVLPQLVYYLGENASSGLDFANLVVYTCERSCGDGVQDGYVQEYTWVQAHAQ